MSGLKSGSQEVLDYINKRITIEEIRESARILKRYDMEAAYNLLFGLPMIEKRKHLYESFRLAEGLKKISPDFSLPVSPDFSLLRSSRAGAHELALFYPRTP